MSVNLASVGTLRLRGAGLLLVWLVGALLAAARGNAIELTGVMAYRLTMEAREGPFWCTAPDAHRCRPLGLTGVAPPAMRVAPLLNAPTGAVGVPLVLGPQIFTAFWQYVPGEYPVVMMVLNLYFNGDNDTPAISVIVPGTTGFTNFSPSNQISTHSLDGYESDNPAQTAFDDGQLRVRLGAAFYMPSEGVTTLWRPSDFVNVDRVGTDALLPDEQPDGILVFELVVGPSPMPPTPVPQGGPGLQRPGGIAGPLQAQVGEDQWVPPPTSGLHGGTPSALPPATVPTDGGSGDEGNAWPTPAPTTLEAGESPTPYTPTIGTRPTDRGVTAVPPGSWTPRSAGTPTPEPARTTTPAGTAPPADPP